MNDTYTQGTVTLNKNSHDVTGSDTYFEQLGGIAEGSLFTIDGSTFYQVIEVVSETHIRIESLITRLPYQEDSVSDTAYTIVKSFARQTNTGLAAEMVAFQNMLMQHRFDFYSWMGAQQNTYPVTEQDITVDVITPFGLEGLANQAVEQAKLTRAPSVSHTLLASISQRDNVKVKEIDQPPTTPPEGNEILVDNERQEIYLSATDAYLKIPKSIATRNFCIMPRGRFLRFSPGYSGTITMRVYPFVDGGLGLPYVPALQDFKWQEFTVTVPEGETLFKVGEYDSEYFNGIIDWIKLDSRWATLNVDKSHYDELNLYFDNHFGTLNSPMRNFTLRDDGYWYSDDMTPTTPNEIGASWVQSNNDYRTYSVNASSDENDALQLFSDALDEYEFEVIINVSSIGNRVAVTNSNSPDFMLYNPGVRRFIINRDRIYFKRNNSSLPITATFTIESVRMRIPNE
jgi:hypothetical protein